MPSQTKKRPLATEVPKRYRAKKWKGAHFLQHRKSRTFSWVDLMKMTEEEAKAMFLKMRWPSGTPTCPKCNGQKHYRLEKRDGWKCAKRGCYHFFSITSGTIFAHRKKSYLEYLVAIRAFVVDAKGDAAISVSHALGCDYKVAFVICHKIREAFRNKEKSYLLDGTIEIDGKRFDRHFRKANREVDRPDERSLTAELKKTRWVVSMRERRKGGRIKSHVFRSERQSVPWIAENVDRQSHVITDCGSGWSPLREIFGSLSQVNHDIEYSSGNGTCTNQVESLFSRMERQQWGIYHKISGRYLERYASESNWREMHRRKDDRAKVELALTQALACGKSNGFTGYWQHHGASYVPDEDHDVFGSDIF